MNAAPAVWVVIVTRDHAATIEATLVSLAKQSMQANRIVVVDCASRDRSWMERMRSLDGLDVITLDDNAGFTGGNNAGWSSIAPQCSDEDLVLFLNPDVLLPEDCLERLAGLASEPRSQGLGAWSPRLLGWDFDLNRATGRIDSTGIFPHSFGRWVDRRHDVPGPGDRLEDVPALCGAFFFARAKALRSVASPNGCIWDDRYFAYKEDIELSLRMRRRGWRLGVWHAVEAWHGRGWTTRSAMSRAARLMSARNEVRLHREYAPLRLPFSLAKWFAVRWLGF